MNILGGILISLFKDAAGVISTAWGMLNQFFGATWKVTKEYNQQSIAFARQMGMSQKEADSYTRVLLKRAEKLGEAYGISAKQVFELQENLANATNKAMMLSDKQAEKMLQINKLVGANVVNTFSSEMMNKMGGQLSAVQGAVSKAYAIGAKSGLNAAKFSEKVAQNLGMANKLSFRNGVDGIMRMTALSEKLGFNLQSVEQAASNFMELDKAIENSAQLQMLGGAASAFGGNPLTMAFEANYDPEAFTKRMTDTLGGLATFDKSKGYASMNGMNMDFARNIAKAMGISADEAVSIAKKQAEIKYKEGAYGTVLGNLKTKEQRDFVLNKSYVDSKTGHLMINDVKGNAVDISRNGLSDSIIEELQKFDGKSDSELMEMQAKSLTSIDEHLQGIQTTFDAKIAQPLANNLGDIRRAINYYGKILNGVVAPLIVKVENWLLKKVNLSWIIGKVDSLITWLRNWGNAVLIAIGGLLVGRTIFKGWKLAKSLSKGGPKSTSMLNTSRGNSRMWGGIKNFFGKTWNGTKNIASRGWNAIKSPFVNAKAYGRYVGNNFRALRRGGNGIIKSSLRSLKGPRVVNGIIRSGVNGQFASAKALKFAKGLGRVAKGGGLGIVGALGNMAVDSAVEAGKIKRGGLVHTVGKVGSTAAEGAAMGAMLGSIVPGLGTAVGTVVGGVLGAGKGYYDTYKQWKEDPKNADKGFWDFAKLQAQGAWSSVAKGWDNSVKWIKDKWASAADKISSLKNAMKEKWDSMISSIGGWAKNAWQGFKNKFNKWKAQPLKEKVLDAVSLVNPGAIAARYSYKYLKNHTKGHTNGGIIGGNSFNGDRILTRVNSGEMILNKTQQANLFKLINNGIGSAVNSTFGLSNDVKAKPVGEKEYVYVPTKSSVNGVKELTVKDININVSGTIKLDGGSSAKDIDINKLLNDSSFVSSLKEIIKSSINNDMNGGRFMNDNATLRGSVSTTTLWGR